MFEIVWDEYGSVLVASALLVAAFGCETPREPSSFQARDSAGMRIVENYAPAWTDLEVWSVGDIPSAEIGVVDGPEEYQFTEIVSAFRLRRGHVIVVDGPSATIRAFDEQGQFLVSFSGKGDGPGELQFPTTAFPYRGDSIAVWDAASRQLSVFDAQGSFGRRTPTIDTRVGTPQGTDGAISFRSSGSVLNSFSDGTFLVVPDMSSGAEPGALVQYDVEPKRFTPEGELLNGLGRFQAGAVFITDFEALSSGRPPRLPVPYTRHFVSATGGSRLFVGADSSYQIRVVTLTGAMERLIRAHHRDLRLGEPEIDAYRREQRRRLQEGEFGRDATITSEGLEAAMDELSFPTTIPPFSEIVVDSEGFIWTLDSALPEGDDPMVWSVFDPYGRLLGEIETPGGMVVEQIGEDYLLGVVTDEFDVPRVRLYSLRRGS